MRAAAKRRIRSRARWGRNAPKRPIPDSLDFRCVHKRIFGACGDTGGGGGTKREREEVMKVFV